jgi:hypothetical protein
VVQREELTKILGLWRDPRRCMLTFHIEDTVNKLRRVESYLPEQEDWVDALLTHNWVLAVKPRQLGFTTITILFLLWKALRSRHGRKILSMVHEDDAIDRLNQMVRVAHDELNPLIRPGFARASREVTEFRKFGADGSSIPGSMMVRRLAGGRGQGRSWTFNDFHATEMAKWPSGTSASRSQRGKSADEESFGSALATIHDPTAHVIVESTGNGPRGLFYELYRQALVDPKWRFVFQKWTDVPRYSEDLSDGQARALEADLDDEEKRLVAKFALTLGQLAWRRTKMRTLQMTARTFRCEFPLTHKDPFIHDEHGWFDQEALSELLQFTHPLGKRTESYRVFLPFEADRKYSIGCDTAGGVGRDEAVIQVIRDDLVHAAIWASNRADPIETAVQLSRLSNAWGRPPAVVELNNHGQSVVDRAVLLGVPLWHNHHDKPGFWSSGDGAGNSKRAVMVHAREVVREGWTIMNDDATIVQGQDVVEKHDGRVEAATGHDDRIYAYALALWDARRYWRASQPAKIESERDRVRRILSRRSDQWLMKTRTD